MVQSGEVSPSLGEEREGGEAGKGGGGEGEGGIGDKRKGEEGEEGGEEGEGGGIRCLSPRLLLSSFHRLLLLSHRVLEDREDMSSQGGYFMPNLENFSYVAMGPRTLLTFPPPPPPLPPLLFFLPAFSLSSPPPPPPSTSSYSSLIIFSFLLLLRRLVIDLSMGRISEAK